MAAPKKEYQCALVLTHDLIGGKWKLRILWHVLHGDNRYMQLCRAIPDITQKVLTTQLRELEISGLLTRTVHDDALLHVEYTLSPQYERLVPVIEDLCAFSRFYAGENDISLAD